MYRPQPTSARDLVPNGGLDDLDLDCPSAVDPLAHGHRRHIRDAPPPGRAVQAKLEREAGHVAPETHGANYDTLVNRARGGGQARSERATVATAYGQWQVPLPMSVNHSPAWGTNWKS